MDREADDMPGSFRMWRWLSAMALVAVGLVMGASVAGAQEAPPRWPSRRHALACLADSVPHQPRPFRDSARAARGREVVRGESTNWSGQIANGTTFTGITGATGWCPTVAADAVQRRLGHLDRDRRRPHLARLHHPDRDGAADPKRRHLVLRLVRALPGTAGHPRRSLARRPDDRLHHTGSVEATWTITIADITTGTTDSRQPSPTTVRATPPSGSRSSRRRSARPSPRWPTSARRRSPT